MAPKRKNTSTGAQQPCRRVSNISCSRRRGAFIDLNSRRQKKRKTKPTGRTTSIRTKARIPTRSNGTRDGSSYADIRRVSSSPLHEPKSAPTIYNTYLSRDPTHTDCFRNCYCDVFCVACAQGTCPRTSHAGLYCSGDCDPNHPGEGRWLHAKCIGGVPIYQDHELVSIHFPVTDTSLSLVSGSDENDVPYYCNICKEKPQFQDKIAFQQVPVDHLTYDVLKKSSPSPQCLAELEARLGYDVEHPPDGSRILTPRNRKIKYIKYVETITNMVDDLLALQTLLNTHPQPYPTERPMKPAIAKRMAICGRRFEIMQLTMTVQECSCCGCIEPYASDPWYQHPTKPNHARHAIMKYQLEHHADECDFDNPDDTHDSNKNHSFQRVALSRKFHQAYYCCCADMCKGGQWCSKEKTTETAAFRTSHNLPKGHKIDLPIQMVCRNCYNDTPKLNKVPNLSLSKRFSARNNYGPVPVPPSPDVPAGDLFPEPVPVQQLIAHYSRIVLDAHGRGSLPAAIELPVGCPFRADYILRQLLDQASPAEEAATRSITAFVKMHRLKMGNLKATGTTTCVVQDSVVNWILPNLPENTRVVTLHKSTSVEADSPDIGLEVYRYERARIELILRMLLATDHPAFRFKISEENLSKWKPKGTLYGVKVRLHDESLATESSSSADSDAEEALVTDEGDVGPAPLQNAPAADHVFTGSEGHQTTAEDPLAEANHALDTFQAAAAHLNGNLVGDKFQVPQRTAAPTGDFVDMNNCDWAWTKAFPTLFVPVLVDPDNNVWGIVGDRNNPIQNERDRPSYTDWADYMMWRNDGRPARHPVFCFVLNSEKQKKQMFSQTNAFLNFGDNPIDATASLDQVKEKMKDPARRKEVSRSLQHYTGNVAGTDQYWSSRLSEFQAVAFFQGYVRKNPVRVFHTLSLAEYHDPFLRRLLGKYVEKVEEPWLHLNLPGKPRYRTREAVLNDDKVYNAVMHDYKTVVTHFFAAKSEMWLSHFLRPVHGIEEFSSTKEFAKSRGAIHLHGVGYGNSEAFTDIDCALATAAKTINKLLMELDAHIEEHFDAFTAGDPMEEDPRKVKDIQEALKARIEFLEMTEYGRLIAQDYAKEVMAAEKKLDAALGKLMEEDYGLTANHAGVAPASWRDTAAGRIDLGHRKGDPNEMVSRAAALEKKELRRPKYDCEGCLCERKINMQNHCFNHACSDYCWYTERRVEAWLPDHEVGKNGVNEIITCKNGSKRSVLFVRCCRMGFGDKQTEAGPDGDRTGGVEASACARIEFDNNHQVKFVAARNHPTVLQEPVACFHFGANSDLQIFLVRGLDEVDDDQDDDPVEYETLLKNLMTSRHSGLDNHTSANTAIRYTLGYSCKGQKNSLEWDKTFGNIVDAFSELKKDATFQNIIHKFGYQVLRSRDVPRDEASYVLSRGDYVYSTTGVVKMSLSSVTIKDLTSNNDSDLSKFHTMYKRYAVRPSNMEGINFYLYVSAMNQGKAPHFMGYPSKPMWPLTEAFARCQLFLFKPHRCKMDDLKINDSFVDALLHYLSHPDYPRQIWAEIIKAKHNVKHIEEEGRQYSGGVQTVPCSQSSDRSNEQNAQHASVNNAVGIAAGLDDDNNMADGDFGDSDFSSFPVIDPDRDWSRNYDPDAATWMNRYKAKYYSNAQARVDDQPFAMDEEGKYRPENAKGHAQTLLIGMFLILYKRWLSYFDAVGSVSGVSTVEPPPSLHCYVQGNPGTGKSYVIRTLNNCLRMITGAMDRVLNLAPTGCAASLIGGKTTNRGVKMPTGKKLTERVDETLPGKTKEVTEFCTAMSRIWMLIKDEHSMDPRAAWAWVEARTRLARHRVNLDDPNNPHNTFEQISFRPFGGIPFVFSFGDCQQLPPVGNKSHFDPTPTRGESNGADGRGKLVFDQFLCPADAAECMGVQVVMDQTVRQRDPKFLQMVTEMRSGKGMSDDSMDLLLNRCLDRLPPIEREKFIREALYIMPTWKSTIPIIKEYLLMLMTDVCRVNAVIKPGHKSHVRDEISLPLINALSENSKVMLLMNFIVELGFFNGAVGTVVEIVYEDSEGPRNPGNRPAYVVVDFPHSTVPASEAWNPDHPTWVPVPMSTQRCEKSCCSVETIPLRVAKAITIDKSQGSTVGKGEFWEFLVVQLPASTSKRAGAPGLAQVAVTRVTATERLAMLSTMDNPLTKEMLCKIGVGPAYERRHAFEQKLKANEPVSQAAIKSLIIAEDPNFPQTFDGGYKAIVQWYRDTFWAVHT